MWYSRVLTLFILGSISSFSAGAEDKKTEELKRTARNPGLLHLAHAGHSVGNYVGHGEGGGGGPHIVIVGTQEPRVITRVASQDSIEELEADLKQHYSSLHRPGGIRYIPNSSARQHLSYAAPKPGVGNDYRAATPTHEATYRHNTPEISYRTFPILYNQPLGHPAPFPQFQPILGHPQGGLAPLSPTPQYQSQQSPANQSPRPTYQQSQNSPAPTQNTQGNPTPATVNYASPAPFTASLSPLSHTIATPGVLAQNGQQSLPLFQALPGAVNQGFQGFQPQLGHQQGPIFVPIQALGGGHPLFQGQRFAFPRGRNLDYDQDYNNEGRSNSFDEENRASAEDERQNYFDDVQARGFKNSYPTVQRGFETSAERHQPGGYENPDFDKSFRYGSEEANAAAAASPAYRNSNSQEGKGSAEDSSLEIASGERSPAGNSGTFKYSFGDNHGITGRSSIGGGDAHVATSYQSVTFETHSVPVTYVTKKP